MQSPPLPLPQDVNMGANHAAHESGVCSELNCGEGGCVVLNGQAKCVCIENNKDPGSWQPPDAQGRCKKTLNNVIEMRDLPKTFPFLNSTKFSLLVNDSKEPLIEREDVTHILILKVTLPVLTVVCCASFILLALCFYKRRRKSSRSREVPKNQSPAGWLQAGENDFLLDRMAVQSRNPTYYDPMAEMLSHLPVPVLKLSQIKLDEVAGEGAFGRVYKGYCGADVELAGVTSAVTSAGRGQAVAVKVLKEDASPEAQKDFKREVEITSAFSHDNILRLLAVVTVDRALPHMVFEFMELGELTGLLRENDPACSAAPRVSLEEVDLVNIAAQVASGMVYLAEQHFVHRDLASRNCLVGSNLVVKISDFGMSRDIYTCDYYKVGGSRLLPVRWMSPESVKYGKFTTESDVWSYGVVLWEIFSHGKQPYGGHSNEEVIGFIEQGVMLQRPPGCPAVLYHVTLDCWRTDPVGRLTFKRAHKVISDYHDSLLQVAGQNKRTDTSDVTNDDSLAGDTRNVKILGHSIVAIPEEEKSVA